MKDNFKWQTEEDDHWDDSAWQERKEPKRPPTGFNWRYILVVLILIFAAAGMVFRQWRLRLDTVTNDVEVDLLSTHNLLGQAIMGKDRDLFAPLLSGREIEWTRTQEMLAMSGLFFDRNMAGLQWVEAGKQYPTLAIGEERLVRIEISPGLDAAELTYLMTYADAVTGGEIDLQQTAVYRRGESRWLYAPPLPEFWGDWASITGEYATGVFPLRDEELVVRLLIDLDSIIGEVCDQLSASNLHYPQIDTCAENFQLMVRFDSDPALLLNMANLSSPYIQYPQMELPAPTLLGYPVDDAGYQALLRGYARPVVSAVIADHIGYACCTQASFFQHVMNSHLAQMGLVHIENTPPSELLTTNLHPDRLFLFWTDTDFSRMGLEEDYLLTAFIHFLLEYYEGLTSLGLMQRIVSEPVFIRMWSQLLEDYEGLVDPFNPQDLIAESWWFHTYQESLQASEVQPTPFPNQDLEVACSAQLISDSGIVSTLYRHQLGGDAWIPELTTSAYLFINPFPDDEAIILQAIEFEEERWYAQVWKGGISTDLVGNPDSLAISLGETDPSGRYILMYVGDSNDEEPELRLVDREICNQEECVGEQLFSTPIWSPNGENTLLSETSFFDNNLLFVDQRVLLFGAGNRAEYPLQLGDRLGQPVGEVIGIGLAPFWVDENHFGFIRLGEPTPSGPLEELVIKDIFREEEQILIDNLALKELVFEMDNDRPLYIAYAQVNPRDENQLAVMAYSRQQGYLFLLDRRNGELDYRLQFSIESGHAFGYSADGRYLVITGNPGDLGPATPPRTLINAFMIHDIAANKTRIITNDNNSFAPAYTFDWSENGEWLVMIMSNKALGLYAPAFDYFTVLTHDVGECSSIAWVNNP